MKAGWRAVPLGEVCEFRRGLTYAKGDEVDSGGTAVLRAMNIDLETGKLDLSDIRHIAPAIDVPKYKMVEAGTLLICTASGSKKHLGKAALIEQPIDFAFGGFMGLLVPSKSVLPKFLHYVLRSDAYWEFIDRLSSGTNINNLKFSQLSDFPIPLPPLDEQKQIVSVLDEAFEGLSRARANAEANLADARGLFAAALKAEFARSPDDWREVALSEIGATVTGSTPRTSDSGNLGGYLPFIKPGDFLPDGRLDYGNEGLSEKGAAVSRILPPGCALMVCIGATIGKAGYNEQKIATNQQINALVPSSGISGEFVYLQMISPDFQHDVLRNAGQATLPIINKSKWSALKVRVPKNLAWQHEITERMRSLRDVISDLEARYSAAQLELDILRQSLLQKAFSGELT